MKKRLKIRSTESRETADDLNVTFHPGKKREKKIERKNTDKHKGKHLLRPACTEIVHEQQIGQQECHAMRMFPNLFSCTSCTKDKSADTARPRFYTLI
jgi:hypothetical protein